MWNYNLVVPNFVLLATFLVFYFSKPRLPLRQNKTFLKILLLEISLIFADLFSSFCSEQYGHFSLRYLRFINTIYFVLFLMRSFYFFIFTIDVLKLRNSNKGFLYYVYMSVFVVSMFIAISNLFTNTIFAITERGYSSWRFYDLIYVFSLFYILLAFILIISNRAKLRRSFFITALTFNAILFVGYIVRKLFPYYLIMDSFCILAIIIIYITYENPFLHIESRSGVFNKNALTDTFAEMRNSETQLIFSFAIHNYNEMREIYSGPQIDRGLSLIGEFLHTLYPYLSLFYANNGMFVILGKDGSLCDNLMDEIDTRFTMPWQGEHKVELYLDVGFVQVEPGLKIKNPDLLTTALFSALSNVSTVDGASVIITSETINAIEHTTEIKRSVERAVEHDAVELFLQPLVEAKSRKLVGAEALARIRSSDGELLQPSSFIPIAEKNGRISILGEQMFERACKFVHDHDIKALGLNWINVNLSPIQFLRRDLSESFLTILNRYGVSADKIHLEITEESMVDYALLNKQIANMKRQGFHFVLDDYGKGYSNVTRLKRFPFINVKIDMELVWDFFKLQDDILPTLVQTFKKMNFSITAEGIENEEMAVAMENIGCDYLQGFLFSQPLTVDEFVKKYSKT